MTIQSRTRIRTGTAAEWSADNPILSIGELGIETDFLKLKCGNGVDAWNTLIYVNQAIISVVGLTGAYADLTGKPTLGTAAATASSDYATAAQGATANSALQPAGNGGSLTGLTKTQVGLANADNTSDAGKPVSTAQQTALDLKANAANPVFTGTVTIPDNALAIADTNGLQTALDAKQVAGSYATGAQGALADTALQTNAALGTPVSGVATNLTGTAAGMTAGNATLAATVTTNANLTGHVTSSGNAAVLGSFTIAQLSAAISDANISGTNTGDQTSIVGITGTVAQFNTACTDANFQEFLVSATNIKTINGSTVLGAGDLVVSGTSPEVLQSTRQPAADVSVAANFSVFADEEFVIADGFEVLLETNASLMIL